MNLLRALHWIALLCSATVFADTIIPMNESGRSTFVVNGEVGDFGELSFLVDTGAAFTTITEAAAEHLLETQQATYLKSMEAVYADGSVDEIHIYRIDRITIGGPGSDCLLTDIEVAVIPGVSGDRCLLGLSVLKHAAPFGFQFDPPALQLSGCQNPTPFTQP